MPQMLANDFGNEMWGADVEGDRPASVIEGNESDADTVHPGNGRDELRDGGGQRGTEQDRDQEQQLLGRKHSDI